MSIENGLVVITGGTRGIGLDTVIEFAKAGYEVITCSSSTRGIENLKNYKDKVDIQNVDMTNTQKIQSFGQYIRSKNKNIFCLINNMGVFTPGSLDTCTNLDDLEMQVRANLFSAAYMFEALKAKFLEQKSGCVVNISSIAGIQPLPNSSHYCISKFALQGYSRCLRQDMKKHGVRVITVMPGATLTSSWDGSELPESSFIPSYDVAKLIFESVCTSSRTVVEELLIRPVGGDIQL